MYAYKLSSYQYNTTAIRQLLPKIFTDSALIMFCYDHFPTVYQQFQTDTSLNDRVSLLVNYCEQNQLFDQLLPLVRDINPNQFLEYDPVFRLIAEAHQKQQVQPVCFFVSYKLESNLDGLLVAYLQQFLTKLGHAVYISSVSSRKTVNLNQIDQQIQQSDFVLALLSNQSVDSEMMRAEIQLGSDYKQQQGTPNMLLIRMAYEGLLPYSIDRLLNQARVLSWQTVDDHERIGQEILAVVEHQQGIQAKTPLEGMRPVKFPPLESDSHPVQTATPKSMVSEDGRPMEDESAIYPPMPEFDPRFLEKLTAPGGAIKPRDLFYVERQEDELLKRQLDQPTGTTTTIRASRQMGKSSLLVRGVNHARENQSKIVYIDLQGTDNRHLDSLDSFLCYLGETIIRKLRLDIDELEKSWQGALGPKEKLTYLMEDYILRANANPIVLALDEVDLLVQSENAFHTEFFGLLRSWHNNRAYDFEGQWDKLYIVMAISTEPYLLINDVHQSPFNVGLKIYLEDFSSEQVSSLNWQHGAPVGRYDFGEFMSLLNGHPYLTRKALYTMVLQQLSWSSFYILADDDDGPFGDHLLRNYWLLVKDDQGLAEAMLDVIDHNNCTDEVALFRLLKAGLIKGGGNHYTCRCDLYRRYFRDRL
ncbi:AAA-like domain-containing protein [Anaerolineales bacterium HSG25]|nr:AAA-like domain-containing protein [Anaerolineales bacterium HSG25]